MNSYLFAGVGISVGIVVGHRSLRFHFRGQRNLCKIIGRSINSRRLPCQKK